MYLALNAIDPVKDQYGLSNVDFNQLTYSDPIIAYDYTDEGLVYNAELIPIKYEESIVGWVNKATVGCETIYQFSTAFIDQLGDIIDGDMEFTFIYDCNASYLYDGSKLYKLCDIAMKVETRAEIGNAEDLILDNISLKSIDNNYSLQYSFTNANARVPVYYECDIDYVSQNPPSNLCWAASAACIINYLKGTNYTAVSIAKSWYQSNDKSVYDKKLDLGLQDDVLSSYGVYYTYKIDPPSAGVILNNIVSGYPVHATFSYIYGYHDVVIYGINPIAGYTYLMDPQNGFFTATHTTSVGLTYTVVEGGLTLFLDYAACKYWA